MVQLHDQESGVLGDASSQNHRRTFGCGPGLVLLLSITVILVSWTVRAAGTQASSTELARSVVRASPPGNHEIDFVAELTGTWRIHLPYGTHGYLGDDFSFWFGQVVDQWSNCGLTRVFGHTLDQNGNLVGDIWVHYWGEGWEGDWAKSLWFDFGQGTPWPGDDGNWDGAIAPYPRTGVWHVCVTEANDSWTCISNLVDAVTSSDCINGVQVVRIRFQRQD